MKKRVLCLPVLFLLLSLCSQWVSGQGSIPEVLTGGTVGEQVRYIEERTKIYDNYRAIREDMYQKLTDNLIDSVNLLKTGIYDLSRNRAVLQARIDSLGSALHGSETELGRITDTKNSFRLFGMEINKITYNAIIWIIILGLLALSVILAAAFKKNHATTNTAKKEVTELREEFDAYRKSSREAREKMSMEHFREIRRLRGG